MKDEAMDFSFFEKDFRAVSLGDDLKIFNQKSGLTVDEAFSFDSEKEAFTSLDYFVSAVLSEILLSMKKLARKKNIIIQDLEAKAKLTIQNPMYLLSVVGYEDKASIAALEIDIYFFSFLEEAEKAQFLQEVLDRTLIYNTLSSFVSVHFKSLV